MAGKINVTGALRFLRVTGAAPGTISAGIVGDVEVFDAHGPTLLNITEGGVDRQVTAETVARTKAGYPTDVTFEFLYESDGPADPTLTIRDVTALSDSTPTPFDLALTTSTPSAKFNLARLDALYYSGIEDITVDGDLLDAVTAPAEALFGLAPGIPGGIQLPLDAIGNIKVTGKGTPASVVARSVVSMSFGS